MGIQEKKNQQDLIYKQEAERVGLEFIKRTKVNHGLFKASCGHNIELQYSHVRRNNWRCEYCFENRLIDSLARIGASLLGESTRGSLFRQVRLSCGHLTDLRTGNILVLGDTYKCSQCYKESLEYHCENNGVVLLEDINTYYVMVRFKKCGHIKEANKAQIFRDNLVCRDCVEDTFREEALQQGLILNGAPNTPNKNLRNYILPCGCTKDLRPSHVRESRWACDIHDSSHLIKESFVYLLLLRNNETSFLKLGYSRDVDSRALGYGFSGEIDRIHAIKFPTGRQAMEFEQSIHKKYRKFKLNKNYTGKFMSNGKTECYPLHLMNDLLKELEVALID